MQLDWSTSKNKKSNKTAYDGEIFYTVFKKSDGWKVSFRPDGMMPEYWHEVYPSAEAAMRAVQTLVDSLGEPEGYVPPVFTGASLDDLFEGDSRK